MIITLLVNPYWTLSNCQVLWYMTSMHYLILTTQWHVYYYSPYFRDEETEDLFQRLRVVPWGYCNKLPKSWWLKTTDIYSFTVLETRSPKRRCGQAVLPSEDVGENPFLCLQVPGGSGCPLPALLQPLPFCLCVYVFSSLSPIRTFFIGFRVHLNNPGWPILRSLITSTKPPLSK